jgi:hypothetical protein
MTCLYCGKKLGFFSRYKDTPFCSEEHLRIHQDELERALMERLGSKAKTPQKPLASLAEPPASAPTSTKSLLGLEDAVRPVQAIAPPPPPPPPPAPTPAAPPPPPEAAPLNEDFLFEMPAAQPALEASCPLIPPSSFAIIVQADCCTPQLALPLTGLNFPPADEEFLLEPAPLDSPALAAALPDAHLAPLLEEATLPALPGRSALHVEMDFGLQGDIVPLDYETVLNTIGHSTLGHREEIPPRPRLRYPYAASQVSSVWNLLPQGDTTFAFTSSDEWDAVLPSAAAQLSASAPESPQIPPSVAVPLTISALTRFQLDGAAEENPGDSLTVLARSLAATPALGPTAPGEWQPALALPLSATSLHFQPRWQAARSSTHVPPVSFPSLFQLQPVLPPRPESRVS